MSDADRERYGGWEDAGRRYTHPMRDEAVIRTACGCQKIVSIPTQIRVHQSTVCMDASSVSTGAQTSTQARYMTRRFTFNGMLDVEGRRIFEEWVDPEDWKGLYQQLYKDIYEVDRGL